MELLSLMMKRVHTYLMVASIPTSLHSHLYLMFGSLVSTGVKSLMLSIAICHYVPVQWLTYETPVNIILRYQSVL